jgi:CelD/BcsL family acetyltransferase involved in cellulose biosynthesis
MGNGMLNTHDPRAANFSRPLNSESETDPVQARLADALVDLHNLLREYAPSWYTLEHHTKVESALQLLKRH